MGGEKHVCRQANRLAGQERNLWTAFVVLVSRQAGDAKIRGEEQIYTGGESAPYIS